MAEMNLFMTEEDERKIVVFVLQDGCSLVPDLDYRSSRYELISTASEYAQYRLRTRLFFIVSDRFFKCPLEMRRIQKDGKNVYYISQRSGGPTIQFLGGGLFKENGGKYIRPGFLSYYPTYWNTLTSRNEKPPLELLQTYKSLQACTRGVSVRIRTGRSVIWLGEDSQKAVLNGAKLVGFEHLSLAQLVGSLSA